MVIIIMQFYFLFNIQAVPGLVLWSGNIFFVEIGHEIISTAILSAVGHEIISTAILSLPLTQVGQLSVTGERMCTKFWLTTLKKCW